MLCSKYFFNTNASEKTDPPLVHVCSRSWTRRQFLGEVSTACTEPYCRIPSFSQAQTKYSKKYLCVVLASAMNRRPNSASDEARRGSVLLEVLLLLVMVTWGAGQCTDIHHRCITSFLVHEPTNQKKDCLRGSFNSLEIGGI